MYRTLVGILGAFAIALLGVALTFSASGEQRAQFSFINGTEPATLDPGRMTGNPEGRIASALFEGLTRRDPKTLEPLPGAAEAWEISRDQKVYTFRMREAARWSDGRPVTAHDFVYSWMRLLDPDFGSEYAYILHVIRHAAAFNAYRGHAQRIEREIGPGLDALARAHPGGIPAEQLQRFFSEKDVFAALQGAQDEQVRRLLGERQKHISRAELDALRSGVNREAQRLARAYAGAKQHFGKDQGLYAKDERTLVVELVAPTAHFLEITSFHSALPVPRWLVEAEGLQSRWFLPQHIVCNGPYLLGSWRINDRLRLVLNETYWGKQRVRSKTIDALSTENETTALNLYLTGAVEWLPDLYPKDLVGRLKQRKDFYSEAAMGVYYYLLNTTKPPFSDRRVRQALALAIDRERIVKEVIGGGQLPAYHLVPPGMPGYDQPPSEIRLDVARARALLAEAGYPEGRGFPKVGILYNTNESHKKIAEVVADQLKRNLGITITAYNQEWQAYLTSARTLSFDMARRGWIGDYHDPNTFLDMFVTNGGNNQTGFSSPTYDYLIGAAGNVDEALESKERLLSAVRRPAALKPLVERLRGAENDEARSEARAELRLAILAEAEAIIVQQEFPILPVYFYVWSGFVSPQVRGFYPRLEMPDGTSLPNLQNQHPLDAIQVVRGGPRQEALDP
jgi:oligopeptide transport system substrate-binding protein